MFIHTVSLTAVRSAEAADWAYEGRFVFNADLTAKSRLLLRKESWLPLDSANVVFLDQDDKVLVGYDFSPQARK